MGSISTSHFSSPSEVHQGDEAFGLIDQFKSDTHPHRVNLGPGIYLSDGGKSWPLSAVREVEKSLHEQEDIGRHDYLPIAGDQRFLKCARELVFSATFDSSPKQQQSIDDRIVSVQSISGTGANHLGARFLAETIRPRHVWLSDPTWVNHHPLWQSVGIARRTYPYYKLSDCTFDFAGMMEVLERESQPRDVLVLHSCAHNPTGLDPTKEQWIAIAELCQRKGLFPFFDNAYQGFATGDPVQDAWAMRYFHQLEPPLEMCVAQSFSKNFGLYGQRVGAFHLVVNELTAVGRDNLLEHLSKIIRSEYSVSPRHGSDIVRTVLESETLTRQWLADLQVMSDRIRSMRIALYDELCRLRTPGSWRHLVEQIGMFSYTGLTPFEVEVLRKQFHIYALSSGRFAIAGLNFSNVQYVAAAINIVRVKSLNSEQGHTMELSSSKL